MTLKSIKGTHSSQETDIFFFFFSKKGCAPVSWQIVENCEERQGNRTVTNNLHKRRQHGGQSHRPIFQSIFYI